MWLVNLLFFGAVILMISFIWPSGVGAPWVPTSREMVRKMLKMADIRPDDIIYDLGCGDGRLVITAARKYGASAVGIEIDPLRYLWCQMMITILGLRNRVKIKYGNFFRHDLSPATVVTCYLLQETNQKLEQVFKDTLQSGTRIVSNTFTFTEFNLKQEDGDARLYSI